MIDFMKILILGLVAGLAFSQGTVTFTPPAPPTLTAATNTTPNVTCIVIPDGIPAKAVQVQCTGDNSPWTWIPLANYVSSRTITAAIGDFQVTVILSSTGVAGSGIAWQAAANGVSKSGSF